MGHRQRPSADWVREHDEPGVLRQIEKGNSGLLEPAPPASVPSGIRALLAALVLGVLRGVQIQKVVAWQM